MRPDGYVDELAQVVDNQSGTATFGYDVQGNLASRNGVGYTFDAGNRLRNVTGEEGGYAYDAWGRRVAQTDVSGTIYSFYDRGGQLIYQRDRNGGTHDYLYLGGHLVAIRDYDTGGIARVMRYQHTDALGSVIRQTDKSGVKIPADDRVYDAWGGIHGSYPQDGPGYTGHVEDADTNLVYMQQRYYDPSVGRFLSMDPVDASGTDGSNLDRYWYAKDNPYRYTDPDGRCADGTCDVMVRNYGAWANAHPKEADKLGSAVGVAGVTVMLSATGAPEAVGVVGAIRAAARYVAGKIASGATRRAAAGAVKGELHAPGDVRDSQVIVRGGGSEMPKPGSVFSGSQGSTVEEAATGVPHGQIRTSTAGEIRANGGAVDAAPEPTRSGQINGQHVNVTEGGQKSTFSEPRPNPVPKKDRIQ